MNEYIDKLNKLDECLQNLKKEALENEIPIIKDESLALIKMLIEMNNVNSILEIGCAVGYSSLSMYLSTKNKINTKIDTIERNELMYQTARENIKEFRLDNVINVHFGDALTYPLENLQASYDLIFIDAAKAQYQKFFERFEGLLTENGIIICDNIIFHGCVENQENLTKNVRHLVEKINNFNLWLKSNSNYQTVFLSCGDGLAIARKKK